MCIESKPRVEFLFQDVDDPFLQDLEDPEDPFIHYTQEYIHETNNIQKILNFIILFLPYIFIGQSISIYAAIKIDAFILVCNTLIYGMTITINQLHDKKTINYWVFVAFVSIILNYTYLIMIYAIPFLVNFIFNKNNIIITYLVEHCGIIWGHHMYWSIIIWIWLLVYPNIRDVIIVQ
jgi:hypothetical protein